MHRHVGPPSPDPTVVLLDAGISLHKVCPTRGCREDSQIPGISQISKLRSGSPTYYYSDFQENGSWGAGKDLLGSGT